MPEKARSPRGLMLPAAQGSDAGVMEWSSEEKMHACVLRQTPVMAMPVKALSEKAQPVKALIARLARITSFAILQLGWVGGFQGWWVGSLVGGWVGLVGCCAE
jgi:hypothetical protein